MLIHFYGSILIGEINKRKDIFTMKKILALIMALCMICALCACGAAKEDNVLTMATNAEFPPYEFYENDKIVGIDEFLHVF